MKTSPQNSPPPLPDPDPQCLGHPVGVSTWVTLDSDPVPGASGTTPLLLPKGLQSQVGRQELPLSVGAWKGA